MSTTNTYEMVRVTQELDKRGSASGKKIKRQISIVEHGVIRKSQEKSSGSCERFFLLVATLCTSVPVVLRPYCCAHLFFVGRVETSEKVRVERRMCSTWELSKVMFCKWCWWNIRWKSYDLVIQTVIIESITTCKFHNNACMWRRKSKSLIENLY